jgi:pyruvate/2-oxoglutarate dehydrogenase complex dihydrolipoamide acyltransferase (E2) component
MTFFVRSLWTFAVVVPLWLATGVTPAAAADAFGIVIGHVAAVDKNPERVKFRLVDENGRTVPPGTALCAVTDVPKSDARALEVGDQVKFLSPVPVEPSTSCELAIRMANVDFWWRLGAVVIAAAVVLGVAFAASSRVPTKFLLGMDKRYSNSQCQLALWFGVAITFYLATIALRVVHLGWEYLDGVSMTANVMALTGLSALTFGGAKAVTAQKVATADAKNAETVATVATQQAVAKNVAANIADAVNQAAKAAGAANAGMAAESVLLAAGRADVSADVRAATDAAAAKFALKTPGTPNILTDLFQNDKGEADIGDFQMIFVALVAAVVFALSCFSNLATLPYLVHVSLPDVDSSLLAGFGIGQGAYLVKKAALPADKG